MMYLHINKELIVDFMKKGGKTPPQIQSNRADVERMERIKFLGVTITDNLSWTSHINAAVKKVQQHLLFIRWFRKFGMSMRTLNKFYSCTTECILPGCITAWYSNCSAQDRKKLQKGPDLLSTDSIYTSHCR
eukprot:g44619.t1